MGIMPRSRLRGIIPIRWPSSFGHEQARLLAALTRRPINVIPLPDYRLLITFSNDEKRIFDVKPYLDLKPFIELKNPALFNTVKPAGLSIEWIHGQDICPDELYYDSVPT